ncbi:unnamed protein product [Bursaphelenchus okinawaensis]|uniref:DREV methyltransferase n=1 Tax=Bursaphelenchus okinawaensis TaxID=465554 RepID=A0A811LKS8_9BILA|nr:unnamed protein product [Bursaphelenchus okinawaensis]CAG9125125.1 unnamed protein product [Bursaphelenchus okinawaensis]
MQRGRRIAQLIEAMDNRPPVDSIDTYPWYNPNMILVHDDLKPIYYPLSVDDQTYEFLNTSISLSQNFCLQVFYGMCTIFLQTITTKTTINGILGRGRMFVFSSEQIGAFLGADTGGWDRSEKSVIDLGAGDGYVTKNFSPYFSKIYATEASTVMEYRLRQKGFEVLPKDDWTSKGPFNLISALNLLDRFFDPAKLLRDLFYVAKRDKCMVLMAIVLPIKQYVEFHPDGRRKTKADTVINVFGRHYEEHLNTFVTNVLRPNGFELVRWAKVPYLCEGDANGAYYKLDDALLLLKPIESFTQAEPHPHTNSHVIHEL